MAIPVKVWRTFMATPRIMGLCCLLVECKREDDDVLSTRRWIASAIADVLFFTRQNLMARRFVLELSISRL